MNTNSYICSYIAKNRESWRSSLEREYGIRIKEEPPYAIFNYNVNCDFWDPIVQEARGIIINTETLDVACWPFRKFGNYNESYADEIDWESAVVLEKIDGSIIKLWYDPCKEKWQFSTNAMIRAENARIESLIVTSFSDVIKTAVNYPDIKLGELDKNNTYIFELVSPKTRVVIDYGEAMLYHIGTRSNITGIESNTDIGIIKPKTYPLSSLPLCIAAAAKLNEASDDVVFEGFVVVDKRWNRVKVKSADYLTMNRLRQVGLLGKKECIRLLLSESPDIEIMTEANPALVPLFKYYEYRLAELCLRADNIGMLAEYLYAEYGNDRAAVAKILVKHELSAIGFMVLDRKRKGSELLMQLPIEKLIAYIPEYEFEDIRKLLSE